MISCFAYIIISQSSNDTIKFPLHNQIRSTVKSSHEDNRPASSENLTPKVRVFEDIDEVPNFFIDICFTISFNVVVWKKISL